MISYQLHAFSISDGCTSGQNDDDLTITGNIEKRAVGIARFCGTRRSSVR